MTISASNELQAIKECQSLEALEDLRVSILGKKGRLTEQLKALGTLEPEERKIKGELLNKVRETLIQSFEEQKAFLESAHMHNKLSQEKLDLSLPHFSYPEGKIHPLTHVIEEVIHIFGNMGFSLAEGPEIEEDALNFDALNIPANHSARQEQDTFYLPTRSDGAKMVLRTQTSPVQIRTMRSQKPPIRIIVPGRTFRSDYDATHTPMFHQVEGLYIDKNIHMGHLKGCLSDFFNQFFETPNIPLRLRPSYFPFTEPSAEVDIGCIRTKDSLKIGPGDSWLEILGCGMVHPHVLKNAGLDPNEYQGFAFGMGLERIGMLKYGIPDLRMFYENDMRWLKHFGFSAFHSVFSEFFKVSQ